jgi:benzoyl-CoA reductase/2-hydroxyglutaryl-CoA dehydratase subunit BcrC/BadD/HgdB
MKRLAKFVVQHPDITIKGIKGFMKQPLTPRMFYILMQYITRSKLVRFLPWVKTGAFTAGFPVEIARAFNVFPYYPEAYGALTGAAECTLPSIEHAESLGYSKDLCSYMKTSIGASRMNWPIDFGGYQPTDMYFSSNGVCDTHLKWFENEAKIFSKPHFGLDLPSVVEGVNDDRMEEYIDYIEQELWDLVKFLEKNTGKKFNEHKFLKIIDRSYEGCKMFMDYFEYRKRFPANQYFEWVRIFMLPMLCQWNENDWIRFYKSNLKKAEKRYGDSKIVEIGREKYRVGWEGITIWYGIDLYKNVLGERGAKIVIESYTESFSIRKKPAQPTVSQTFRQIARELIANVPYTCNLATRMKHFDKIIQEYDLDGLIMLANQSCRPQSTGLQDLRDHIVEKWGIPVLILNSDHCDPRAYAEGPINTRIDGFIEMMDANKKKKASKAA